MQNCRFFKFKVMLILPLLPISHSRINISYFSGKNKFATFINRIFRIIQDTNLKIKVNIIIYMFLKVLRLIYVCKNKDFFQRKFYHEKIIRAALCLDITNYNMFLCRLCKKFTYKKETNIFGVHSRAKNVNNHLGHN